MVYKNGIIRQVENGKAIIEVDLGDDMHIINDQNIAECEVAFTDGRKISAKQRKYIYALIRDISKSTGLENELMKETMKSQFCLHTGEKPFSLSDVDMTTAKNFLDFLVDFCTEQEVPTAVPLAQASSSAQRYIYACCMSHKCCILGGPAVIYNLDKMSTEVEPGDIVLPLCNEAIQNLKTNGKDVFITVNAISPITADEKICEQAQRILEEIKESE